MKYALTCLAGLMALGLVALAPDTASARYHGWGWGGGPGFGVYVGPRYGYGGYYGHGPYYNRYSYGYGPRWAYRHRDWD